MMMKKIANILSILLINLILANAILPHHHHNTLVCIEKSHCENDKETHKPPEQEQSHQHDKDFYNCILKQFFLIKTTHLNKCNCFNCNLNNTSLFTLLFILNSFSFAQVDNKLIEFPPFIQSEYALFVSSSNGLRSPPSFKFLSVFFDLH